MNINEFLPNKVCVNLDRRPERWEQAKARFARHQLSGVTRFGAVDGVTLKVPPGWESTPGAYGCLQSHMSVVREAQLKGLPRILILEDDVVLDPDFNVKFSQYIQQVPSDWDMLFFGGLHLLVRPDKISENVSKLNHSYSTFAYAMKDTVYDAFLDLNSRSLEPVDKNNVVLQQAFNCYCFEPPLAWVEENYSDTEDKFLYPWYVKEGIVIASPEWDQIQRQTAVIIAHQDCMPDSSQKLNLKFKLDYYSRWYSHMTLFVVEQGRHQSVDPESLPKGVHYEFLPDEGAFDPRRCFEVGFERFATTREFFIFSESNIHLDRENVLANLEQCLRYDFVSSFQHFIDLSSEDTRKLIEGDDLDLSKYPRLQRDDILQGSCIFTRSGMNKFGGWAQPSLESNAQLQLLSARGAISVFESPNNALRLFQTRPK